MEFIARRWWRRAEVWAIAIVLVAGGTVLGYQACYWSLAEKQSNQVQDIRRAYDAAMVERDRLLEELTKKTGTAAEKASKAATAAAQAADKADEALNRIEP
jgi:predicted negative regulator of RcsB-dependent stress response